jgi:hypothetical protein
MGGDVAIAVAGVDRRDGSVAAIVASADWTSPGMHGFEDPSRLLAQGEPDAYAQCFYEHLDPLMHLDAYAHGP